MWGWTVIEIRKASAILKANGKADVVTCWNPVFRALHKTEEEAAQSFDGCQMWLEKNRVEGSEYVINEMFFVPTQNKQSNGN